MKKITANSVVVKIVRRLSICTASVYLTFLVDISTLNTVLKRVFVFSYFVLMCALFLYLKKRFLKTAGEKRSVRYTAVIFVVAASVLMFFQDSFLPPLIRSNLITLKADNSGEVWLIEAAIDGESVPLSQLDVVETTNWQYSAAYDDYVYYPEENLSYNGLTFDIVGNDVKLSFGVNSWSGSVLITNTEGETETIVLHAEDAQQSQFTYAETGERLYSVGERILFNLGALVVLVFFLNVIADVLMLKLASKLRKRTKTWKWYHWAAFLLLDAIITFQFTAQFLFMDVWQTRVEPRQLGLYLLASIAGAIALMIVFSLINFTAQKIANSKEEGSYIPQNKRTGVKWWMLCISLCTFGAVFVASCKVLPDMAVVSDTPTEVTLTLLSDHNEDSEGYEMLLSKCAVINGTPVELTPIYITGQWNLDGGYFWGLGPGSTITFSLPAAEDIDLRFDKHAWSGIVEIEDGEHRERLDLYSNKSKDDYQENYRIKSNRVSGLSKAETALIAVLIGMAFAGIACLLIYTTFNNATVRSYRLALFLSISSIWLVYLCAGNPGGVAIDTLNQFAQAKGSIAMTDAHPALLTIYYRWIFKLTDNPVVFSLVQIAFFALIVAAFLGYLSSHGISRKLLSVFGVLFGAHIVNGIYASTLWKDIPYTICLLWLTFLLTKLGIEKRAFFCVSNIIQLAICIPLAVLLRHNGIVVFILVGIVLAGFTIAYRSWRPIVALLLSILVFWGVKGPVYASYNVMPNQLYSSSGLVHGIAYASLASEESTQMLDNLMPLEDWKAVYTPYSANSLAFSEVAIQRQLSKKISNLEAGQVNREYFAAFLKHPFLIMKDRLFGCNLLWNSIPSGYNWRTANDQYSVVVVNNDFGYYCRENVLTDIVNDIYQKSIRSFWSDMFIWRAGPYISLSLILLFLAFEQKKYAFALSALPLLGNSASLLLAMAWQDYRYVYFAMVCSCFLTLSYFVLPENKSQSISP